jgi:tetratricopeptide (TPR) repeat protein
MTRRLKPSKKRLKPESMLYLQNLAASYIKIERLEEAQNLYLLILAIDKDNEPAKQMLENIE